MVNKWVSQIIAMPNRKETTSGRRAGLPVGYCSPHSRRQAQPCCITTRVGFMNTPLARMQGSRRTAPRATWYIMTTRISLLSTIRISSYKRRCSSKHSTRNFSWITISICFRSTWVKTWANCLIMQTVRRLSSWYKLDSRTIDKACSHHSLHQQLRKPLRYLLRMHMSRIAISLLSCQETTRGWSGKRSNAGTGGLKSPQCTPCTTSSGSLCPMASNLKDWVLSGPSQASGVPPATRVALLPTVATPPGPKTMRVPPGTPTISNKWSIISSFTTLFQKKPPSSTSCRSIAMAWRKTCSIYACPLPSMLRSTTWTSPRFTIRPYSHSFSSTLLSRKTANVSTLLNNKSRSTKGMVVSYLATRNKPTRTKSFYPCWTINQRR